MHPILSGQTVAGVAQATLDRLRRFARQFPEVVIFPGHEAPAP
jgi:hypothetical protein